MKRKGFTLLEAMICVMALSVFTVVMCRFGNTLSAGMKKTSDKTDVIVSEYEDVAKIRESSLKPDLINHPEYFKGDSSGNGIELWCYKGEYFVFYKAYKVG